jgi:hypothetical protein
MKIIVAETDEIVNVGMLVPGESLWDTGRLLVITIKLFGPEILRTEACVSSQNDEFELKGE